jgi:DNA modification methylase
MTNPIKDEWRDEEAGIRLILGDCLEILPTLEAGSVDAVVTDPPYPTWYTEEYCFDERVTSMVLQMDWPILISFWTPGAPFPTSWDSCHAWDKVVGTHTQFELIYLRGLKQGHKLLRYMTPHSSVRAQICGDTKQDHKSQKPLRLMVDLLDGLPAIICDPFTGSGTTLVACIRTGRRGIGIEIEPKYFEIAVQRCKKALKEDRSSFQIRPKPRKAPEGFFKKEK